MIKKDEAINKIIDYSLYKNKQNSNMYIKFVYNNITKCEKEIEDLEQNKCMFYKKDIELKIQELNKKIYNYYLDIEKEIENIF